MGNKRAPKYQLEAVEPQLEPFLRRILHLAGLRLRFQIRSPSAEEFDRDFEIPDILVEFFGPDVPLLLANRAELLRALEHIAIEKLRIPQEDHDRICFDAESYRTLRIEELRLSALGAAERVKRTGQPFEFAPMTSRERRIIHLALRHEPAVVSLSTGTGSQRHVVVYPAGSAPQPSTTAHRSKRLRRPSK